MLRAQKRFPVKRLGVGVAEMNLGTAKVYHLPNWYKLSHPERLAVLRRIAMSRGRDPRMARLATKILRDAKVRPRRYEEQAEALLKWTQNPNNVYYVNEPGERLQDPLYTIKSRSGDCFPAGTLLLRNDGSLVPVEHIKEGDFIWGRDRWSRVEKQWSNDVLPITEIGLNNGSILRLTENHGVYVRSCPLHGISCPDILDNLSHCEHREFTWTRIQVTALREGMELLQPGIITTPTEGGSPEISEDDSWLLGAFIAEGWSEEARACISGLDGGWKEATKHRAKTIALAKGWKTGWHKKYLRLLGREAAAFFGECGKGAINKRIPTSALLHANAEALDEGLKLDSSENSRGNGWTFGTISPTLSIQYRVLQRRLGRSTSIRCVTNHGGFGSNAIYRVGVRNSAPDVKANKRLRVKTIHRNVTEEPVYDVTTDDHYVYLPEVDATVSNCDDQTALLCSLFESVGLPWRLCLSGRDAFGNKVRYIEGYAIQPDVKWSHIYSVVGVPPFNSTQWYFCEPTIEGVPLGWDVLEGDLSYLPNLKKYEGQPRLVQPGRAPVGFRPSKLPSGDWSPAYAEALGPHMKFNQVTVDSMSQTVGASIATEQSGSTLDWSRLLTAVATGVVISVITPLIAEWIRGTGMWAGQGTLLERGAIVVPDLTTNG